MKSPSPPDYLAGFRKRLAALMKKQGLNPRSLAIRIRTDPTRISRILSGDLGSIRVWMIVRIAFELGVSTDELLDRDFILNTMREEEAAAWSRLKKA